MTAVHDKRRGMPCYANSRTFPHRDSVLPWRHKVGVVTSQFQRLARRESTMSGFLKEAANLAAMMLVHGYPPHHVTGRAAPLLWVLTSSALAYLHANLEVPERPGRP